MLGVSWISNIHAPASKRALAHTLQTSEECSTTAETCDHLRTFASFSSGVVVITSLLCKFQSSCLDLRLVEKHLLKANTLETLKPDAATTQVPQSQLLILILIVE